MAIPRRRASELFALYAVDKSVVDLFTEGSEDRILLEQLFPDRPVGREIYSIDDIEIDFDDVYGTDGARGRVVFFTGKLAERALKSAFGVIDRDCETADAVLWRTDYLLVTRHACLDLHIFDSASLLEQLRRAFGNRVRAEAVDHGASIAKMLFAVRCYKAEQELPNPFPANINRSLTAANGGYSLDLPDFLARLDNTLRAPDRRDAAVARVQGILNDLAQDGRLWMNIHDFEKTVAFSLQHCGVPHALLGGEGWLPRYLRMGMRIESVRADELFVVMTQRLYQ